MKNRIVVVGGGASGMAAAYGAAKCGAIVTILEKKEQLGKKLSVTGNGRCNFTHKDPRPEDYRSHEPAFLQRFLIRFGTENAVGFFEDMHLLTVEKEGYYYPATMQAQSVVSALTDSLKALHVEMVYKANVEGIDKQKDGSFVVRSTQGNYRADSVILACGTEASVKDLYAYAAPRILRSMNQPFYPFQPALTYLTGDMKKTGFEPMWSGVRIQAAITYRNQTEEGEIQLTEKGISGIPVFQLSHFVIADLKEGRHCRVMMDFLPAFDAKTLTDKLMAVRNDKTLSVSTLLTRWIPKKLAFALLKQSGIQGSTSVSSLSVEKIEKVILSLKGFLYPVIGFGSLQEAQVCQGGCDLTKVDDNFESTINPGIYITGELLDVDGKCGGYNLHFAFGSGLLAGTAAACKGNKLEENE